MTLLVRALLVATLVSVLPRAPALQAPAPSVLHIKIVLLDAEGKATPVPRHALLISDNPPSAAPRYIVTTLEGTADVRLRPGNYTVESDKPVAFNGKAYQWTQIVDVAAGSDAALHLTADNAESAPVIAATTGSGAPLETDPSFLLNRWQDSVVALWTPTLHASGFVFDARGLIATNQRVIGSATSVEVQLTPAVKVAARVLAADPERDVAVLWVDPAATASVRPVPLDCAQGRKPSIVNGQEIFAIGVPLRLPKGMTSGEVSRVGAHVIVSDLRPTGSAGGPVFTAGGIVVGITSVVEEQDDRSGGDVRVVRIDDVCAVVAAAEKKMNGATPPDGTHLPLEPAQGFPLGALKAAVERGGSLTPYQMSSSDFDIALITPVLIYRAQSQPAQASGRNQRSGGEALIRPLIDFSNWSEYVADIPPVLLIRVTPKLVEGFWTKVGRAAASTQGVSLPPMKRFKSGFARMRVFCGDREITPIHPFKLEHRVSASDTLYEGLYVLDPGALGPDCGSVKLMLYSEKEPEKGDTRVVDAKLLQQIWEDFAPYRGLQ